MCRKPLMAMGKRRTDWGKLVILGFREVVWRISKDRVRGWGEMGVLTALAGMAQLDIIP